MARAKKRSRDDGGASPRSADARPSAAVVARGRDRRLAVALARRGLGALRASQPAPRHHRHPARRPRGRVRRRRGPHAEPRRAGRARRALRARPERRAAHRALARDDPHRPLPARARRPRQRRLLARRAPPDAGHAAQGAGLPHGGVRGRLSRWPPPSASARASTRSARTSRRARSRARARSGRPTRWWTPPSPGWPRRADAPFFVWVHLYDPHAPYDPPEPYRTRVRRPPLRRRDRLHGRAARAACSTGCARSGHEQDTVVAVLADHGESLGRARRGRPTPSSSTRRRCASRFSWPDPGVPRGRDRARPRDAPSTSRPPSCASWASSRRPRCPAATCGPRCAGERLPPEPLYAESLFGRLNCRWSSLRGVDGGRLEAHRRQPGRAVRPRRRPRRDAGPRGGGGPARRAHARRPAAPRWRKMAPGGDRAAHRRHHARAGSDAARASATWAARAAAATSTSPACPTRATACSSTSGCRSSCARRHPARARRPRRRRRSRRRTRATPSRRRRVGFAGLSRRADWPRPRAPTVARSSSTPTGPAVRQNYGKLLRDMGRLEDSEKELRLALEQTDARRSAHARRAWPRRSTLVGKTDEAGRLIGDAAAHEPGDPEALAAQGRLLAAQGKLEEAAKSLGAAADSGDTDARIELARVYVRMGDLARAREAAGAVHRRHSRPSLGAGRARPGRRARGPPRGRTRAAAPGGGRASAAARGLAQPGRGIRGGQGPRGGGALPPGRARRSRGADSAAEARVARELRHAPAPPTRARPRRPRAARRCATTVQ